MLASPRRWSGLGTDRHGLWAVSSPALAVFHDPHLRSARGPWGLVLGNPPLLVCQTTFLVLGLCPGVQCGVFPQWCICRQLRSHRQGANSCPEAPNFNKVCYFQ